MSKIYRGWKVWYLPFLGEYKALNGNTVLYGKTRVEIEREIDKIVDK